MKDISQMDLARLGSGKRPLTDTEIGLGFVIAEERTRQYVWGPADSEIFHNVWAVAVRPSGRHRLMCDEGLIIVNEGWQSIHIDAEGWDF